MRRIELKNIKGIRDIGSAEVKTLVHVKFNEFEELNKKDHLIIKLYYILAQILKI